MTPRPTFRPSSTGPRLPISIDPDGPGQSSHTRPLPSLSPSFDERSPTPILEHRPRPRARRNHTFHEHEHEREHRYEHPHAHGQRSASSDFRHHQRRIWEEDNPPRQSPSIPTSSSTNMMLPASAQHTPLPQRGRTGMDGYFPSVASRDFQTYQPQPQVQASRPATLPIQPINVIPISEAPRNSNGSKKQQSGRKRTACDRCKRQKSSVRHTFHPVDDSADE